MFGVAPDTGMPFADFGQLVLGMQGVEHGVSLSGWCVLRKGEQVPRRWSTGHVLITAKNVFRIYPPIDMN